MRMIKTNPYNAVFRQIGIFIVLLLALLMTSCAKNEPAENSNTGNLTFSLNLDESLQINRAAAIDCSAYGIATVTAQILDATGKIIATGGPWDCIAGDGFIEGIQAGQGYLLNVFLKDSNNFIRYQATKTGLTVQAGTTSDAGTLTLVSRPGNLDPTFGSRGTVTTGIGTASSIYSLVEQADGKIVAGGYSTPSANKVFTLGRYGSDGTLDTSFGTLGITQTAIRESDQINSVVLQGTDNILAAGYSRITSSTLRTDFTIARYNVSDGSLDASFGPQKTGVVTTSFMGYADSQINALGLQSDGKIIAAGRSTNSYQTGSHYVFALARYTATGSIDTSFGTSGFVSSDLGTNGSEIQSIVILSDDSILAAGFSKDTSPVFAMAKYSKDGVLDSTFGTNGVVRTQVGTGSTVMIKSIAVQTDGKIIAAGISETNSKFLLTLARYEANGALDTSFGTGGIATAMYNSNELMTTSMGIQSNGSIVVAGAAGVRDGHCDFYVARYDTAGIIDTLFGDNGFVTTVFGTQYSGIVSMIIQGDGKIVAGGLYSGQFALARYLP